MWSQVSYIFRPMTPYTVMPLKMISLAKSTGTASLGMPSSWTRPPIHTAANAWWREDRAADGVHDRPNGGGDGVQGKHVGDGHRDVLGERPVPVHADDAGVAADVPVAGAALEAVAAHDVSLGGDELSDLQVRDPLAP